MDAATVDLGWVLAGALAAVLGGLEVAKKSLSYFGPLLKARLFPKGAKTVPGYAGPERRRGYGPEAERRLMEQHRAIIREVGDLQQATKDLADAVRDLRQDVAVANKETHTKIDFLVAAGGN